jgi:hypothetical protein
VSAQGTQPATTPGVTRKILSQMDGPAPGYVTILAEATIEAGVTVGRHTHPGIESAYVLEVDSSYRSKVSRHEQSKQAMASKYRRRRPMRVAKPVRRKLEFLSRTSWRKESLLPLQPD